jgi:hypothetical protein
MSLPVEVIFLVTIPALASNVLITVPLICFFVYNTGNDIKHRDDSTGNVIL